MFSWEFTTLKTMPVTRVVSSTHDLINGFENGMVDCKHFKARKVYSRRYNDKAITAKSNKRVLTRSENVRACSTTRSGL